MNKAKLVTIVHTQAAKSGNGSLAGQLANGTWVAIPKDKAGSVKQGVPNYAIVIDQLQTKTRNAAGELVDLPANEQRTITLVTMVSDNRQAVMQAFNADRLLTLRAEAEVAKEAGDIAKEYADYGYTAEKLMELIG